MLPDRVAVVGNSGAGKTTLARQIAERTGVPHVELDAIHHQAGWRQLPLGEVRRRAAAACPPDGGWVLDGNYASAGAADLRAGADTVVWLDLPRPAVMRQIVLRTLGRIFTREELWNGNRESLRNAVSLDPERSIIRWAWTRHARYARLYEAQMDARWVRLRSRAEVDAWLASL